MSIAETKVCQKCKQSFVIEPEDFAFYERIKVPPPTWCPECRLKRRLLWRNTRNLYKRKEFETGREIFSMFSPDKPINVYDVDRWYSDNWDPLQYEMTYNFSRPFLEQFRELIQKSPWLSRFVINVLNSNYCSNCSDIKNCYLCFAIGDSENCFYSEGLTFTKDSMDCYETTKGEMCYHSIFINNCYRVFFSSFLSNCSDIYFSEDLTGCDSCIFCFGLRNKKYHIFNKPFTKEKFDEFLKNLELGSYVNLQNYFKKFFELKLKFPHKYFYGIKNQDFSGDYIYFSKNVKHCYLVNESENLKYCSNIYPPNGSKDSYDQTFFGKGTELIYESHQVGLNASNVFFSSSCFPACNNIYYSILCSSSSHLFGCVGLRNKQYCILNKQYTKEEYEALVPKIIKHMNDMPYIDAKGRVYRYGEFFPPELSPFAYNETIAQEYFPKTKEQALAQGYRWKDPEERNIKPDYYTKDLADHIKDVKDDILGKIIQCAHSQIKEDGSLEANCNEQCTTAFKIIPQELEFYRRMNLPLPRLCPNCRHFQRLKQRNPLKLWHRKCQCQGTYGQNPNNSNIYQNQTTHFHQNKPCSNEFYTSYAPDRPEIVYCDKCYQAEVY